MLILLSGERGKSLMLMKMTLALASNILLYSIVRSNSMRQHGHNFCQKSSTVMITSFSRQNGELAEFTSNLV